MRYPAPENYGEFSSFELLGALSRGVIPADHRLIHALVDEPSRTLPGILQFAQEYLEECNDSDTSEIVPELAKSAAALLTKLGLANISVAIRQPPPRVRIATGADLAICTQQHSNGGLPGSARKLAALR